MDYPNQHMVDAVEALGDKWRVDIELYWANKDWVVSVSHNGVYKTRNQDKNLGKAIAGAYEILIQKEVKGLSILKAV